MKLLFITGLYPDQHIELLRNHSNGYIQNAPNVFQWAIVEGLHKNKVDFEVLSFPFLPSYPLNYGKLYSPSGQIYFEEHIVGEMVSFCDLLVYKTYSIRRQCKLKIEKWLEQNKGYDGKLVILTYTPYHPFLKAIESIKDRYPNLIVASIVTDLVDNMLDFQSNRSFLKRIQCYNEMYQTKLLYKLIDKFILLTQPMLEKIPEALNKSIIVEGIYADKESSSSPKTRPDKSLLYTGTLEKFSGVEQLIDAFVKLNNPMVRLVICGSGQLETKIKEAAKNDPRIIFKGLVTRDEALNLQKEALLLINPRRPDGEITRFSFPSKTMEYLSSGTPMIGYKLEGIPSEYYNYYYTIDDLSEKTLIRTLEYVLSLPLEVLNHKADTACEFIKRNKTAYQQVNKIIKFISL